MTKDWQTKFYKAVGEYLAKKRVEQRLTPYELAKKAGQQFNTIDRVESGKPFYFFHIVWISDALGISVDEMLLDLAPLTRADARVDVHNMKRDLNNRRQIRGSIEEEFENVLGFEKEISAEESFDDII